MGGGQICCSRPTFYKQWLISHNIGIGHKQKSRVLYLHYAQLLITVIDKRGSAVNLRILDLSKAFDKVNHYCMFIKLMNRKVPVVRLNLPINWYDKCAVFVRWNNVLLRCFLFDVWCETRGSVVSFPVI